LWGQVHRDATTTNGSDLASVYIFLVRFASRETQSFDTSRIDDFEAFASRA